MLRLGIALAVVQATTSCSSSITIYKIKFNRQTCRILYLTSSVRFQRLCLNILWRVRNSFFIWTL